MVQGACGRADALEDGAAWVKCGEWSGLSLAQDEGAVVAGGEGVGQVAAQDQRWAFGWLRKLLKLRFGCLAASQCQD